MSEQRIQSILEFIRSQGKLPTDQFGEVLAVDDIVDWFGLDGYLSREEMRWLKTELAAMAEMQTALDQLRMSEQVRCDE
jgi:hypothetical protein